MKDITAVSIALLFIVIIIMHVRLLNQSNDMQVLDNENKVLKSALKWKTERLKKYLEIDIKQSEIIDRFQSSRNAKLRDKELMELQTNLN